MKNNAREIGSEFDYRNEFLSERDNGLFESGSLTYSGRTAIAVAVSDILKSREIKTAWLPSYSCESMAQPFHDFGIHTEFYSVEYDFASRRIVRAEFDMGKDDVVLTMGYFGFYDEGNVNLIQKCRDYGITVIEDCTHTLLSSGEFTADYRVASLRKWFPTASGGFVQKRDSIIQTDLDTCDEGIVDMRISAMKEKSLYLENGGDESVKASFLDKYRKVNASFSENYKNLAIDSWSESVLKNIDIEKVKQRRRENAKVLLDGLCQKGRITPVFSSLKSDGCPLFVPILSENRATLQKLLAEHNIYCPVHWPRYSNKASSNLYDLELSLVCDQRYDGRDMEKITAILSDEFC